MGTNACLGNLSLTRITHTQTVRSVNMKTTITLATTAITLKWRARVHTTFARVAQAQRVGNRKVNKYIRVTETRGERTTCLGIASIGTLTDYVHRSQHPSGMQARCNGKRGAVPGVLRSGARKLTVDDRVCGVCVCVCVCVG